MGVPVSIDHSDDEAPTELNVGPVNATVARDAPVDSTALERTGPAGRRRSSRDTMPADSEVTLQPKASPTGLIDLYRVQPAPPPSSSPHPADTEMPTTRVEEGVLKAYAEEARREHEITEDGPMPVPIDAMAPPRSRVVEEDDETVTRGVIDEEAIRVASGGLAAAPLAPLGSIPGVPWVGAESPERDPRSTTARMVLTPMAMPVAYASSAGMPSAPPVSPRSAPSVPHFPVTSSSAHLPKPMPLALQGAPALPPRKGRVFLVVGLVVLVLGLLAVAVTLLLPRVLAARSARTTPSAEPSDAAAASSALGAAATVGSAQVPEVMPAAGSADKRGRTKPGARPGKTPAH